MVIYHMHISFTIYLKKIKMKAVLINKSVIIIIDLQLYHFDWFIAFKDELLSSW